MNKSLTEPPLADSELPYSDACWALLERIVASPQLKRATRLREFLLYVGQRSIKDGLDQIHEQEIGANVFGRPADYDTSLDNIVRVNASELRKRIEDYFESDGSGETLVMEIPRGSYKPIFQSRVVKAKIPPIVADEPSPRISPPDEAAITPSLRTAKIERRLLALAGLLIVVLAAGCWVLWTQNRSMARSLNAAPWQNTPAVASFWSKILGERSKTDILLADTSFALIEDITKQSIPLSDYLTRDYLGKMQMSNLSQDRRIDLAMIKQRNNGSLGDFRAAQHILALDPGGKNFHLYSARDYSPSLVKEDNIILIGARKSNPWVDLFKGNMNFSAEYDLTRSLDYIENRAPAAGEQKTYSAASSSLAGGYCVVAFLPNPQQSGKVLIIAGTDSAATEGGGDFLTSEEQLSRFQKMLHVTTLPYFEVVLKTSNLNGTPIDDQIIAYRTYPSTH